MKLDTRLGEQTKIMKLCGILVSILSVDNLVFKCLK